MTVLLTTVLALGSGLPAGAASRSLPSVARVVEQPGPFSDVPPKAPAYQVADELRQLGLPFERPGCFFASRTLTRYEFAVAVQRMHGTLRTAVRFVEGDSGPGPDFGEPKGALRETLADAAQLQQATYRLEALICEFTPELLLLQDRPNELLANVADWRNRSAVLAVGARKAGLLPRTQHSKR